MEECTSGKIFKIQTNRRIRKRINKPNTQKPKKEKKKKEKNEFINDGDLD